LLVTVIPGLILMGLYMWLLPGLVLGIAPAIFLGTLLFSIQWYPIQRFSNQWLATLVALPSTIAIAWFAPLNSIAESEQLLASVSKLDVLPDKKLRFSGNVRIHYGRDRTRCGSLCNALLMADGIASVTVSSNRSNGLDQSIDLNEDNSLKTYRVLPADECADSAEVYTDDEMIQTPIEFRKLLDVKVAEGYCIGISKPLLNGNDFVITMESGEIFAPNYKTDQMEDDKRWTLEPWPIKVRRLLIYDKHGSKLLQQSQLTIRKLVQPLLPSPGYGNDVQWKIGWARSPVSNMKPYQELDSLKILETHTNLSISDKQVVTIDRMSEKTSTLLDKTSDSFNGKELSLIPLFFWSFRDANVDQQHIDLLERLISDRRITNFEGVNRVFTSLEDNIHKLRKPIALRLLDEDWNRGRNRVKPLASIWHYLPEGSMKDLLPEEERLLIDGGRRPFANGLILRQADRGAAAAPLLLEILKVHFDAQNKLRSKSDILDNEKTLQAAQLAICAIGPQAKSALSTFASWQKEKIIPFQRQNSLSWKYTLARLGLPIAQLTKPEGFEGSDAEFRIKLENRLSEHEQGSGCRIASLR